MFLIVAPKSSFSLVRRASRQDAARQEDRKSHLIRWLALEPSLAAKLLGSCRVAADHSWLLIPDSVGRGGAGNVAP